MPRKKTAKRQTTFNKFASMQKLEKDFLKTPVKLASHLNKEVKSLKQKENKIKNAVNKINAQVKNAESRVKKAAKVKSTMGKKKFSKAKKAYNKNLKAQTTLNKQLEKVSKTLTVAATKQAKIIALRQHLTQFEKDWVKASKKLQAKAKAKTKTKNKKYTKPKTRTELPVDNQRLQPTYETPADDIRLDEVETTS